jgi:hypothetical protein
MKLTGAFGMLMINPSFGKNQSVGDYCKNFTPKSLDVLDRICRLTDGADINSYSLWAFLNLFNMNAFYSIYQPKEPLDQKLWPDIQKKLSCDFAFNTTVHSIIRYKGYFTVNQYIGKRVFIAVPPTALSHIFPNHRALRTFANKTAYLTISWHKKLKKQFNKDNTNDWGNVVGPWGLIWIQLTDYMTMEFPTVLTLSISKQHIKGINGYTAGNATKEQLIKEVLDELSNVFENFCPPSLVIFNPLLYNERNERNERNEWHTNDAAYVKKPNVSALPSRLAENLYTVGWHNDNGTLAFSTLENAVVSAKVLLNELGIQTNQTKIVRPVTIRHVILIILFMILLLFLYLLLKPLIKPLIKPIIGDVNLIRNKLYQRF